MVRSPNVAAERVAVLLLSLPGLARLEVWLFFLRFSPFSLGPSQHIPASYLKLGPDH